MAGALLTPVGDDDANALEAVADEIEAAATDDLAAAAAVREMAVQRRKGRSWRHLAEQGSIRSALDRIGVGVLRLRSNAARLRRTAARGLVAEGVSTRRIGTLFGVSHQRVSSIVATKNDRKPEGATDA